MKHFSFYIIALFVISLALGFGIGHSVTNYNKLYLEVYGVNDIFYIYQVEPDLYLVETENQLTEQGIYMNSKELNDIIRPQTERTGREIFLLEEKLRQKDTIILSLAKNNL